MPLYETPRPAPAYRDKAKAGAFHLVGEGHFHRLYRRSSVTGWNRAAPDGTYEPVDDLAEVIDAAMDVLHDAAAAPLPPLVFRCLRIPAKEPVNPRHRAKSLEPLTAWPITPCDTDAFARWERDERERSALRFGAYEDGIGTDDPDWPLWKPQPMPPIEPVIAPEHRERLLTAFDFDTTRKAIELAGAHPAMRLDADEESPAAYAPETFIATALVRDRSARVRTPDVYRTYRESVPDGRRPVSSRAFRALVRSMLAPAEVKSSGYEFYVGLRLRTVQDDAPAPATDSRPALYAVG